jgi:predicted nucleic acid-binding Zn ribbon protein
MPYYEYQCAANGRTLEVRHGMGERLTTWGELAQASDSDLGDTPTDAPIERLMSAPVPVTSSSSGDTGFQGCGSGCACAPQN